MAEIPVVDHSVVNDSRQDAMPARSAIAIVCLMLLAVTSATASSAAAQTRDKAREPDRERVDRDSRSSDHRALSDAVRRVERSTGGQVLSAERVPYDGRDVNRVKIVDSSGRVRVYVDDPTHANVRSAARVRPVSSPQPTRRDDN